MKSGKFKSLGVFMVFLITILPVCIANSASLEYDANGNLIRDSKYYYKYNSLNQLWKIFEGENESGQILFEFTYHPIEERVLIKNVTNSDGTWKETIYYANENLVRVVNSSGSYDTVYVKHEGQLVAELTPDGDKKFYHPDYLGSTTAVTDESGNVLENTSYTPYGVILSGGEQSRYDYEGKETDDITGARDFHFRMQGIAGTPPFQQPDSVLQNVYDPQLLNRYAFERNSPYKYTDPDGHNPALAYFAWKVWGAYLSLIPAVNYFHTSGSVSAQQAGGAFIDAAISLVPIAGDILTGANTVAFASNPAEYISNADTAVSPGTLLVRSIFGDETKEEKEDETYMFDIKWNKEIKSYEFIAYNSNKNEIGRTTINGGGTDISECTACQDIIERLRNPPPPEEES